MRDDVLAETQTVLRGLETLREQHYALLNTKKECNDHADDHIFTIVQDSIEKIQTGIEDARLMTSLYAVLRQSECEKEMLRNELNEAVRENQWLNEELNITREKLVLSEQMVVQLEVEKNHLDYMISLNSNNNNDSNDNDNNSKDNINYDSSNSKNNNDYDNDYNNNNNNNIDKNSNHNRSLNEMTHKSCIEDSIYDSISDREESMSTMSSMYGSIEDCSASTTSTLDTPVRLRTLHNLVLQYASQGRYEVAVPLCHQALQDMEKSCGHQHPEFATMLNILALVYRDQGRYKVATELLQDVLSIREQTLGCQHPAVAATLNNLAVLCGKRQKFDKAEPLCRRALEIREKVLGSSHPDVAKQLTNLALICQKQNKYDDVEHLYERALDIYENTLGPDSPNSMKTRNILAAVYTKQKKYKPAEHLYIQLLTQLRHERDISSTIDSREPSIIDGQPGANTPYGECGGWHKTLDTDVPSVSGTLKQLSALYRRQGKIEEATKVEACFKKKKRRGSANSSRSKLEKVSEGVE